MGVVMRRLSASLTCVALLGSMLGPAALASDASPAPDHDTTSATRAGSIVMGPPLEQSLAGWREIGRAPTRLADDGAEVFLGHAKLGVVDDRLVLVGRSCPADDGRCSLATWSSDDALTWTQTPIPGTEPEITDLASASDRLVAIGTDGLGRKRAAAMWATGDGVEWASIPAPLARKAGRILATGDTTVVQADEALWASHDGTRWQRLSKPPAGRAVAGPSGFISWRGGGQDQFVPTELWHSPDGASWTQVRLPKALRGGNPAFGEIQVESLGDLWVLIPKEKAPRSIFTSRDGQRWRQVPRPLGMHGGYVWWMARVGDDVQASGTLYEPRLALWSWDLGKRSGKAEPYRGRSQSFGAPVRWGDGYVAVGSDGRCNGGALTVWRWEPPSPGPKPDAALERTGASVPPECWAWSRGSHSLRYAHTSTLLDDARILLVGGVSGTGASDLDTTEVFDPAVESFELTGYLVEGRDLATATRLADGRVLIAGGKTGDGAIDTAELYDPATGLFSTTGSRIRPGAPDDAVLLDDGRVLLIDGRAAEVYDPETGTFAAISRMGRVRTEGKLARLPDGRVLVVGGAAGKRGRAAAEVFDPVTMSFEPRELERSLTGGHTLTTLQDGRVLIVGGKGEPGAAHLYDPATGSFEPIGPPERPRYGHAAVLAPDGRVLLISGLGERGTSRTIEAYDPTTRTFTSAGQTKRPRIWAGATLLEDGRVLVSGGKHENGNVEATAELYDPTTGKSAFIKPNVP
jgi:hypothetical protein